MFVCCDYSVISMFSLDIRKKGCPKFPKPLSILPAGSAKVRTPPTDRRARVAEGPAAGHDAADGGYNGRSKPQEVEQV